MLGVGKSSFLKEAVRRIRRESEDSGVFVRFHEVLKPRRRCLF